MPQTHPDELIARAAIEEMDTLLTSAEQSAPTQWTLPDSVGFAMDGAGFAADGAGLPQTDPVDTHLRHSRQSPRNLRRTVFS